MAIADPRNDESIDLLESLASTDLTDAERSAREEALVKIHLPMARRLAGRFSTSGADSDDLAQVACIALLKAIRRFDPDRGAFEGYARATIRGELKRYLRDFCWTIRPPRWVQELNGQAATATWSLAQDNGELPSVGALAERVDMSEGEVREALAAQSCYRTLSLDQPVEPSGRSLGDTLTDHSRDFDWIEDAVSIGQLCADLDPQERQLLSLRFAEGLTQRQIASRTGMSQMMVSRRLSSLLDDLRGRAEMLDVA